MGRGCRWRSYCTSIVWKKRGVYWPWSEKKIRIIFANAKWSNRESQTQTNKLIHANKRWNYWIRSYCRGHFCIRYISLQMARGPVQYHNTDRSNRYTPFVHNPCNQEYVLISGHSLRPSWSVTQVYLFGHRNFDGGKNFVEHYPIIWNCYDWMCQRCVWTTDH